MASGLRAAARHHGRGGGGVAGAADQPAGDHPGGRPPHAGRGPAPQAKEEGQ